MFVRNVRGLPLLAVIAALLLGMANRSFAADAPAKGKAAAKAKEEPAKAEPVKGRLPAHYADLPVDDEQRKKIYEIQAEHKAEIQKIQDALDAAKAKRDAAVFAVLTKPQQEKLAKLQADDKSKKSKADKADMDDKDKADKDDDAAEKPAAKKKAAAK